MRSNKENVGNTRKTRATTQFPSKRGLLGTVFWRWCIFAVLRFLLKLPCLRLSAGFGTSSTFLAVFIQVSTGTLYAKNKLQAYLRFALSAYTSCSQERQVFLSSRASNGSVLPVVLFLCVLGHQFLDHRDMICVTDEHSLPTAC